MGIREKKKKKKERKLNNPCFRYAGYCPQYRFRCGETYGSLTHKLLIDPTVNHAETIILSNRVVDDYEVSWKFFSLIT